MTTKLPIDQRRERGPFDVIGDVHGCLEELERLLDALGYRAREGVYTHPSRRAVFVGDLIDRGPASIDCLELARAMCEAGHAWMVPGNHESKMLRTLSGKGRGPGDALARTLADFSRREPATRDAIVAFLEALPDHLVLDDGALVVAHAGLPEALHGRSSSQARAFALYGDTTGAEDADGLPVRRNWAGSYAGGAFVVYGHTPVREASWQHESVCIDTGCVFGGALSALRWPERELVSVPAARTYHEPVRPLGALG